MLRSRSFLAATLYLEPVELKYLSKQRKRKQNAIPMVNDE